MPRKTAREEATKVIKQFIADAKSRKLDEITKTRQPKRRRAGLILLDALDLVEAEFYDWLNGLDETP
jgi:hypothetical protein